MIDKFHARVVTTYVPITKKKETLKRNALCPSNNVNHKQIQTFVGSSCLEWWSEITKDRQFELETLYPAVQLVPQPLEEKRLTAS